MYKTKKLLSSFFVVIFIFFSNASLLSVTADLEEEYTTPEGNFIIRFTDDFSGQPLNAVSLMSVQQFGSIQEDTRQKIINVGFKNPRSPVYVDILDQGINAHGGCGSQNYDPYFFGNTINHSITLSPTEPKLVALHEFFHGVQFCLDTRTSGPEFVYEAQARLLQDKLYTDLDQEDGTDFASYFGEISGYLSNPSRPLYELSYAGALFWQYFAEHVPADVRTEPGFGVDNILEFWRAAEDLHSGLDYEAVVNRALERQGVSSDLGMSFRTLYQDFLIANYYKDLDNTAKPVKYIYRDDDQPPGAYPVVAFNTNVSVSAGASESAFDFLTPWTPKYYMFRTEDSGAPVHVNFNQITDNDIFFAMLVVRDNVAIRIEKQVSKEFDAVVTEDSDTIVMIVSGLDNLDVQETFFNYRINNNAGEYDLNIQLPKGSPNHLRASAGPPENLNPFSSIIEVFGPDGPVLGLTAGDFRAFLTNPTGWGEVEGRVVSATPLFGLYYLTINPPSVSSTCLCDLKIKIRDNEAIEQQSVVFSNGVKRAIVVIDKSISMLANEKLEAAKSAAHVYVDTARPNTQLGLVQFGTNAQLIHEALELSSTRENVHTEINNIIGNSVSTSVGDGLLIAQNELYSKSLTDPILFQHIILLTDGKENSPEYIANVRDLVINNRTKLHVIFLGNDIESAELQQLAMQTQGTVHFAFDPASGTLTSDLASIYRLIGEIYNNQERIYSNKETFTNVYTVNEQFNVPKGNNLNVLFNYKSNTSINNPLLVLPDSTSISPTYVRERVESNNIYGYVIWDIPVPQSGLYSLNIPGDSGGMEYFAEAAIESPLYMDLQVNLPENLRLQGNQVPIVVTLSDEAPLLNAKVTGTVTTGKDYRDFTTWPIELFDDGAHFDGFANDGIYGANFTRTFTNGSYIVEVTAQGVDSKSLNYTLQSNIAFHLKLDADKDQDGLFDYWETLFGLDPFVSAGENGAKGDPDNDFLDNLQELKAGTDPQNPDTDFGGELDSSEVSNNRDPLEQSDDIFDAPEILGEPLPTKALISFSFDPKYGIYDLYRSLDPDKNYVLIKAGISASEWNYTDGGLTNNVIYYYKAQASTVNGEYSRFSNIVEVTPKSDTNPPEGNIFINNNEKTTDSRGVTLAIFASDDAVEMRISNTAKFTGSIWQPVQDTIPWILTGNKGLNLVYAQFKDPEGNIGALEGSLGVYAFDGIILDAGFTDTFSSSTSSSGSASPGNTIILTLSALIVPVVIIKKRKK